LNLKQIIAFSCRQKMLLAPSRIKRTHLSNLIRVINSTYNQVNRNLRILVKEDIIRIRQYGHMKMIQLNNENPETQILLEALHMLDRPITYARVHSCK